jgi:hypothetical protein
MLLLVLQQLLLVLQQLLLLPCSRQSLDASHGPLTLGVITPRVLGDLELLMLVNLACAQHQGGTPPDARCVCKNRTQ